jgi:hypothetical protein
MHTTLFHSVSSCSNLFFSPRLQMHTTLFHSVSSCSTLFFSPCLQMHTTPGTAIPEDLIFISSGFTTPFSVKVIRLQPESLGYGVTFYFDDFTNCTGQGVVASGHFGNTSCAVVNMTEIARYSPREPVGTPLFSAMAAYTTPQANMTISVYRNKVYDCDGGACTVITPAPSPSTSTAPSATSAPTVPTTATTAASTATTRPTVTTTTSDFHGGGKGDVTTDKHGRASGADIAVIVGSAVFALAVVLCGVWFKHVRQARRDARTDSYNMISLDADPMGNGGSSARPGFFNGDATMINTFTSDGRDSIDDDEPLLVMEPLDQSNERDNGAHTRGNSNISSSSSSTAGRQRGSGGRSSRTAAGAPRASTSLIGAYEDDGELDESFEHD